ncbi:hypothetical protein GGH92_010613 [Coemansia sp. RSA 2673]|nr:hypothetical protein GGH92_010613 [Coemansia sp. RSA 2673]
MGERRTRLIARLAETPGAPACPLADALRDRSAPPPSCLRDSAAAAGTAAKELPRYM